MMTKQKRQPKRQPKPTYYICYYCGKRFANTPGPGRGRKFCSHAHRQAYHRAKNSLTPGVSGRRLARPLHASRYLISSLSQKEPKNDEINRKAA